MVFQELTMQRLKKVWVVFLAAGRLTTFVACNNDGPAEKAGKKIDKTVEDAKKATKKLFE